MAVVRGLLVVSLALLAPAAAASGSVAVSGQLDLLDASHLVGDVDLSSPDGGLDLSTSWRQQGRLLSWSAARGEEAGYAKHNWDVGGAGAGIAPAERREREIQMAEGSLENLSCRAECLVLLHTLGTDGAVGLRGVVDDALVWTEEKATFAAYAEQPGLPAYAFRAGSLLASTTSADALRVQGAPYAEGRVSLLLWNVSGEFHHAGGVTRFDTGTTMERTPGPAGLPVGLIVRTRFIELELEGTHIETHADATLYAPTAALALDGRFAAQEASGSLVVAGREHRLEGDDVRIDGALALRPEGPGALRAIAPPQTDISGRATSVVVSGVEVVPAAVQAAPAVAALTGGALVVTSLWAMLAKALLSPFYTRVSRSQVLSNENRRRIFESIRARPGVSAADLTRESGLARVVIQHHLRMLEAHQFIVDRRTGRTGAYFVAGSVTDSQSVVAHATLRDETRRALACAIAHRRALVTQRDLADTTGLSQRLVSYHLGRLEASGLITGEGQMPRRYGSTRLLEVALGLPPARLAT